jgi:preprotein translocase subunit SecA
MLAELLNEYQLFYQLLNAKPENVRRESEVVAQAGKRNAITIATNMAGRGTDIVLGGNIKFQIQKELYNILTLSRNYILSKKINVFQSSLKSQLNSNSQKFLSVLLSLLTDQKFLKLSDIEILKILRENDSVSLPDTSYKCSIKFLVNELKVYYKKQQQQESKIIKNLGGLYIMGTERNDSRRVDNQLRGRCGRQGDPGTSRFFLSLEDNLLRLFGGPKVRRFLQNQMLDGSPLEANFLTKSLNSAQQQVEERAYQQRKTLYDYDEILNIQRQIIYFERNQLLKGGFLNRKQLLSYGEQIITDLLVEFKQELKLKTKLGQLLEKFLVKNSSVKYLQTPNFLTERILLPDFKTCLFNDYWSSYKLKQKRFSIGGRKALDKLVCAIALDVIDRIWREHLQKLSVLREEIRWRGYGQQNPLQEYKKEAFKMFKSRKEMFRSLVILRLLQVTVP